MHYTYICMYMDHAATCDSRACRFVSARIRCSERGCRAPCMMAECQHQCADDDHFHPERVLSKYEHQCALSHSCNVQGGLCQFSGDGPCVDGSG